MALLFAVPLGSEAAREKVRSARTAGEMYSAIGCDAWVVVPVERATDPEAPKLEGTRLTIVQVGF